MAEPWEYIHTRIGVAGALPRDIRVAGVDLSMVMGMSWLNEVKPNQST